MNFSYSRYLESAQAGDSRAELMADRCLDEAFTACLIPTPQPSSPHVMSTPSPSIRPTLAELVPQYVAVGISPRNAVSYVVDSRLRASIARGKGRKAARRAEMMAYARAASVGRDIEALNERVARNRRQWAADEAAERHAESRQVKALDNMVNFHE